jgi:hypothetical protein
MRQGYGQDAAKALAGKRLAVPRHRVAIELFAQEA